MYVLIGFGGIVFSPDISQSDDCPHSHERHPTRIVFI